MKGERCGREEFGGSGDGNAIELPSRRKSELVDNGRKKEKRLVVSYEEWEPFKNTLMSLNFGEDEGVGGKDAEELYTIARKMSTPEGLEELMLELEGKASKIEDMPIDTQFDELSLVEKIEKLYSNFSCK